MKTIVTGAANGLGAALASKAVSLGHDVVGIDRDWLSADEKKVVCDLSDSKSVEELIGNLKRGRQIDLLIHNAAISATGPFETIPHQATERLLAVNLTSPIEITNQLLSAEKINPGGTIVFLASLSVQVGYPGAVAYAASKAGLANYAKSLRKALKPKNINVLTVFPGPMKTAQAATHAPEGAKEEKRMAPADAAELIFTAIKARKNQLVPGGGNKFFAVLGTVAPAVTNKAMRKVIYDKLEKTTY